VRYLVLATDYDNTLASQGSIERQTLQAVERLKRSGRFVVLVTGRMLDDLLQALESADVFDLIVAENGALLYDPRDKTRTPLAVPAQPRFVEELARRGVRPLAAGRCIVATVEPNEKTVLDVIRAQSLDLQITFNKGAVMVLPSGIDKASGLAAALDALGISAHNAVGIGDAENDIAFLRFCECAVAVANALPSVKDEADFVTDAAAGAGLIEVIERLIENDLAELAPRLRRHWIEIGTIPGETEAVTFDPSTPATVVIAGGSGSGKSTFALALFERLSAAGYQLCIFDPEGDYEAFENVLVVGDPQSAPTPIQIAKVLANPAQSVIVNLLAIPLESRPETIVRLLPEIASMRATLGRPHWIVFDEAHHLFPRQHDASDVFAAQGGVLCLTVDPRHLSQALLDTVTTTIVVSSHENRARLWTRNDREQLRFVPIAPQSERRRADEPRKDHRGY
jgi:hydroxymethylpyrimidine pyrophosphatase-like HAD family hydrolase